MKQLCFFLLLIVVPGIAQVSPVYTDPFNNISAKEPYISEAIEMIRYGDAEGAIKYIKKNAVRQHSFESEFLTGYAYKMIGDISNAIDYFSKATRFESSSLPAFFERGNCFLLRKNYGQAVFDFDHVILLDSTFAPAYNNRAYARIKNYGELVKPDYQLKLARRDMLKVIQLAAANADPGLEEYYYNLGLLDLFISDYSQAMVSFSKAIEINPVLGKLYYYRGAAKFLVHFYNEAAEDFKRSEELGFHQSNTAGFQRVITLVEEYQASTGEYIGK